MQHAFAATGVVLVVLGFYTSTKTSIYPQSDFWTSSPTWFAMRAGLLMVGVAVSHMIARWAGRWNLRFRPLERFGRSSLFVYWIHVELVYGYASWGWRHRLPLWGALAGCAAFTLLMYGAVVFRDRVIDKWRSRRHPRPAREPATA
jgi:hypothetical protein